MKKAVVAGILCTFAMASASADTLYFVYKGFYDDYYNVYNPNADLTGSFTANDLNSDGVFSKDELISLSIGMLSLDNYCYKEYPVFDCVNDFSYSAEQGLTIDAQHVVQVEYNSTSIHVKTGDYYEHLWSGYDSSFIKQFSWTPETQFRVSTSPVPEPATIAMLGAGLGTLMMARRRRR